MGDELVAYMRLNFNLFTDSDSGSSSGSDSDADDAQSWHENDEMNVHVIWIKKTAIAESSFNQREWNGKGKSWEILRSEKARMDVISERRPVVIGLIF